MYPWSTRGFRVSKTDDPNPDPARPGPKNPRVYPCPCPTLHSRGLPLSEWILAQRLNRSQIELPPARIKARGSQPQPPPLEHDVSPQPHYASISASMQLLQSQPAAYAIVYVGDRKMRIVYPRLAAHTHLWRAGLPQPQHEPLVVALD
ncbi:hypothetical protein GGX14DRAFT_386572 [Mycena pura]|uniref:Uncharacterized protein n=1 Tax=Mycena pura TaxID=153505 RepID=A0AAD6YPW6_9AGAR|nr:hypothetical protein GGX14DRAFT_386572 [Mycena pura]